MNMESNMNVPTDERKKINDLPTITAEVYLHEGTAGSGLEAELWAWNHYGHLRCVHIARAGHSCTAENKVHRMKQKIYILIY